MTFKNPLHLRVLMELRPALDGLYGIPQETRLLFDLLTSAKEIELTGLLQMSTRLVYDGSSQDMFLHPDETLFRNAQTLVTLKGRRTLGWQGEVSECVRRSWIAWRLRLSAWLGLGRVSVGNLDAHRFTDFIWQEIFALSLPARSREKVLQCNYRVCSAPWKQMHIVGLGRARWLQYARYPLLDTSDVDVLIAQTPFPGRVTPNTRMVVHYHDAVPIFMPHTISDRAFHQASHYHALTANVRDGAYFVCVSEATRSDLLSLFPNISERTQVIHNILPEHYKPAEPEPERIPDFVRRYTYDQFIAKAGGKMNELSKTFQLGRAFNSWDAKTAFYAEKLGARTRFMLMVSTIEPRKNHLRLLEAYEVIRSTIDANLKLILVGNIGWSYETILEAFLPWIEQGSLFLLHGVPPDALRLLYRQAVVTVCPSVGEGFDFSGAEAMRCGGVVAASDIPVHREIYGNAAEYFNPYDTASVVYTLRQIIYSADAETIQTRLRNDGLQQSARYLPEYILPQWETFLRRLKPGGKQIITSS
ncbi:glycosyltransferase family 4 protein [Acidithiobacillus ferrooxidans]|uniref:glycosyltransferase family 4 protein n=1 Tax=Acidithiobacillus ferrooxidans TaxID=920 RepID=UPI002148B19B|nr:glycosyltransferase family 1 protein [Acidithiobacillus ferrooxidans]MCR1346998.1 glycosyltransferase family 4 protein [Acidithiobacillus ferrooxidans]MCR1354005.1 glycosyltransferase family 4 protein [Acidithiobacillus ferrooxidans]